MKLLVFRFEHQMCVLLEAKSMFLGIEVRSICLLYAGFQRSNPLIVWCRMDLNNPSCQMNRSAEREVRHPASLGYAFCCGVDVKSLTLSLIGFRLQTVMRQGTAAAQSRRGDVATAGGDLRGSQIGDSRLSQVL